MTNFPQRVWINHDHQPLRWTDEAGRAFEESRAMSVRLNATQTEYLSLAEHEAVMEELRENERCLHNANAILTAQLEEARRERDDELRNYRECLKTLSAVTGRKNALESENARLMAKLKELRELCLCERFTTPGFDYGEKHRLLGLPPGSGKRWLTPRDLIEALLLRQAKLRESASDESGGGANG